LFKHQRYFSRVQHNLLQKYATTLTQAQLQVLVSYSMQCFAHFHVLIPIPMVNLIPILMGIPGDPWDPSLPHSHAHLYFAQPVPHPHSCIRKKQLKFRKNRPQIRPCGTFYIRKLHKIFSLGGPRLHHCTDGVKCGVYEPIPIGTMYGPYGTKTSKQPRK